MKQDQCICSSAGAYMYTATLLVMVNVMKGGGRACTPSPAWANFTLMMNCTSERRRYYSVYSVIHTLGTGNHINQIIYGVGVVFQSNVLQLSRCGTLGWCSIQACEKNMTEPVLDFPLYIPTRQSGRSSRGEHAAGSSAIFSLYTLCAIAFYGWPLRIPL
jgi:hypothetical protein